MQKKIENYIHHYLGCEVIRQNEIWQLKSVEIGLNTNIIGKIRRKQEDRQTWDLENFEFRNGEIPIKPILRPLSDMSENEAIEYFNLHETAVIIKKEILNKGVEFQYKWNSEKGNLEDGFSYSAVGIAFSDKNKYNSTEFVYLLSRGFDLFGLIEAGFAIDRSKLN